MPIDWGPPEEKMRAVTPDEVERLRAEIELLRKRNAEVRERVAELEALLEAATLLLAAVGLGADLRRATAEVQERARAIFYRIAAALGESEEES